MMNQEAHYSQKIHQLKQDYASKRNEDALAFDRSQKENGALLDKIEKLEALNRDNIQGSILPSVREVVT